MPILRSYGRNRELVKPPAYRYASRVAAAIPPVGDLRQWDGPIKNQMSMSSCTGHAFSSINEWVQRKYLNRSPVLSPLYTYVKELMLDGDYPQDAGSTGQTGCEILVTDGVCEDYMYPDASQIIQHPTYKMNKHAGWYRLKSWTALTGSMVAISDMADAVPYPVAMGFRVAASFESNEVATTGVYNPQPGEQIVGGHEMKSSAWDIGTTPTLRPAGCPPAVLFQNSWDSDWGLGGYVWVALSVLDDPNTDLKVIRA
jgi:Papain family cysteine protease